MLLFYKFITYVVIKAFEKGALFMKKTIKKFISVLLAAVVIFSFAAISASASEDIVKDGISYYTYNDGTATVQYTDESLSGDIVIPSTINGYTVTEIDGNAFYGKESITSIVIPNTVIHIDESAFMGCSSLNSITLSEKLEEISDYTFHSCSNLKNIRIPQNVKSIGNYAFNSCTNLTSVDLGKVTSVGDHAFCYCSNLKSLAIPSTLTSIGTRAFALCDNLTDITVEDNNPVYSSDEKGVIFNKNKTEIIMCSSGYKGSTYTIPNTVNTIGDYAFYHCETLNNITIPSNVKSIGYHTFTYCENLAVVNLSEGLNTISSYAFNNTAIKNIVIPDSVTYIGNGVFGNCMELEYVHIPSTIGTIDGTLFGNLDLEEGFLEITAHFCSDAESEVIKAHIKEIEEDAKQMEEWGIDKSYVMYDFVICNGHHSNIPSAPDTPDEPTTDPDEPSYPDTGFEAIPAPSRTTINYGDSIVLHIDEALIPEGGYVVWTADNNNFVLAPSSDGKSCVIKSDKSGSTTITATVYDADGNEISSDAQTMLSKAGFFQKIIAFFRSLLGLIKNYPNFIKK